MTQAQVAVTIVNIAPKLQSSLLSVSSLRLGRLRLQIKLD
jgi:hypothetical protein